MPHWLSLRAPFPDSSHLSCKGYRNDWQDVSKKFSLLNDSLPLVSQIPALKSDPHALNPAYIVSTTDVR